MGRTIQLTPTDTNHCFGCGAANDAGMKLRFELDVDENRARGRFILGENCRGGGPFAHGGIIAVVLDEAMGKLSKLRDERAVTAELAIRYRRPVPVDQEIFVEGWQYEEKGRNRFREAVIKDGKGTLLASGKARFVVVDESHFARATP